MDLLYSFNMVGKVSLYTACVSLEALSAITSLEPKVVLYDSLERTLSYATYRQFFQAIHYLRNLPNEALKRVARARCTACPLVKTTSQTDTEAIVWRFSIDGNFSLSRKNKGVTLEIKTQSEFFCDQDAVDSFVLSEKKKEKKTKKVENLCSNFTAGDVKAAVSRNCKLKTKGTFGACCNHMFPMKFLDMKHGERLAYAKALLRDISADAPPEALLLPNYDIACNFERHLRKKGDSDLLNPDRFRYFIPQMHAHAHVKKCQLEYSPRILGDCGMADGEVIERLWSILGRTSKSMKEMTETNRAAFFDDLLYEFGTHVNESLDSSLIQTFFKLDKTETDANEKLILYLKGHHVPEQTERWREEMIAKLSAQSTGPKQTWEWEYIALLQKQQVLAASIAEETDPATLLTLSNNYEHAKADARALEVRHNEGKTWQLDDGVGKSVLENIQIQQVKSIVRKLFKVVSDMKTWIEVIPNFSRGQTPYFQLHRKIENNMKTVRSLVTRYNKQRKPAGLPKEIVLKEVLDLLGDFWDTMNVVTGDLTHDDPRQFKVSFFV